MQQRAESPTHDSPRSLHWIAKRDIVLLGGGMAATLALAPFDNPTAREFAEPAFQPGRRVRRIADDVAVLGGDGPFFASAFVAAAGTIVGPPELQRFALRNVEAIALATVVNGLGKGIAGRARPGVETKHAFEMGRGFHDDNGPFVSFPSGHTAAAFAMATVVSSEAQRADLSHGRVFGALAYGAATAVGIARVVQREHWLTDLPIAAVIGTWSGHVVEAHADDSGRAASALRGLVVGQDGKLVRVGWSLRASDAAERGRQ
jgi:membrane-associated phospholipid phosphatase